MTRIVAIGEADRVSGFALAGVAVAAADNHDDALAAWKALPDDAAVVILTPAARVALAPELSRPDQRLWVVMPG
jgi:vacuolar-type H+-ATPase subunit F/Vma7